MLMVELTLLLLAPLHGCPIHPGPLVSSHPVLINHPIHTLFEVLGRGCFHLPRSCQRVPWQAHARVHGRARLNGSTARAFASAASLRWMIIALGSVSGVHFNLIATVASMCVGRGNRPSKKMQCT